MRMLMLASAGGAIGAGARFIVNETCARLLGNAFPWATFLVNVVGCGLMGALFWFYVVRQPDVAVRAFLMTGVLGGFTTFSAFSLDVWILFERREMVAAGLYVLGSATLSIAAFVAGLGLAKALVP